MSVSIHHITTESWKVGGCSVHSAQYLLTSCVQPSNVHLACITTYVVTVWTMSTSCIFMLGQFGDYVNFSIQLFSLRTSVVDYTGRRIWLTMKALTRRRTDRFSTFWHLVTCILTLTLTIAVNFDLWPWPSNMT